MTPDAHARVWHNVSLAMKDSCDRAADKLTPDTQRLMMLLSHFAGEIAQAYIEVNGKP